MAGYYVIEIPEVTQTAGGLEMAEDKEQNTAPVFGTVTAVADSSTVPVGTVLVFRKYAIDELKYQTPEGEKKIYLLDGRDILGVVE